MQKIKASEDAGIDDRRKEIYIKLWKTYYILIVQNNDDYQNIVALIIKMQKYATLILKNSDDDDDDIQKEKDNIVSDGEVVFASLYLSMNNLKREQRLEPLKTVFHSTNSKNYELYARLAWKISQLQFKLINQSDWFKDPESVSEAMKDITTSKEFY